MKSKWVGSGREREKQKTIVSINSYLIRDRKFKTNSKNRQKIEKHRYSFFSSQNGWGEAEKERKKKIIVLINSYPTMNRKLKKNSKKIQKIKKHHYGFF